MNKFTRILASCTFCVTTLLGFEGFDGTYLEHKDWLVVCDNTGACRITGYQGNEDRGLVSVMFAVEAGEESEIYGYVQINYDRVDMDKDKTAELFIDGKSYGTVDITQSGDDMARLDEKQIKTLVKALKGNPKVEFKIRDFALVLSPKGFNAVWLKSLEYQGRLEGMKPYEPAEAPVINAAATIGDEKTIRIGEASYEPIYKLLQSTTNKDDCFSMFYDHGHSDIWVHKLNETHSLVQTRCSMSAYNESDLFAVMDAGLTKVIQTFDNDLNDYYKGELRANQKIRGVGDCYYYRTEVWDGEKFVRASEGTTGLCKGVAGGAWRLPRYTSDVVWQDEREQF